LTCFVLWPSNICKSFHKHIFTLTFMDRMYYLTQTMQLSTGWVTSKTLQDKRQYGYKN
jgi:hypothetical protein